MYYTIYLIRNNINNKQYIGQHTTKDLNDNYMGSGKIIKQAFQKYGKENFTKTILFFVRVFLISFNVYSIHPLLFILFIKVIF